MDLVRGASLSLVGQLKLNGLVQTMVGWSIAAEALPLDGTSTPAALTCTFSNAATAHVRIAATPAQTATWAAQSYQLRIWLTNPNGDKVPSKQMTLRMIN